MSLTKTVLYYFVGEQPTNTVPSQEETQVQYGLLRSLRARISNTMPITRLYFTGDIAIISIVYDRSSSLDARTVGYGGSQFLCSTQESCDVNTKQYNVIQHEEI